MSRLLFWLALALLVMFAIRSKLRSMRQPPSEQPHQRPAPFGAAPARPLPDAEAMLCCARCGMYYPASESVRAAGQDYCSAAHAAPAA